MIFDAIELMLLPPARLWLHWRASRATKHGLVFSGLRRGGLWITGPADVSAGLIRLGGEVLQVASVAGPGRSLPRWPGQRDEDYFWAAPPTRVFTLMTQRGPVDWAVLERDAQRALRQLQPAA